MQKTTEDLYGMTQSELDSHIGREAMKASYRVRIEILKGRLEQKIDELGTGDPLVYSICKAIAFWEQMRHDDISY